MVVDVSALEGSGDLIRPLRRLGLEVRPRTLAQMPFGDVAWAGLGPDGPIAIGMEFKRISELLSSITTGRFADHQLRGMVKTFPIRYLLVEGIWSLDRHSGILQMRRRDRRGKWIWADAGFGSRRWMFSEVMEWLSGLPLKWLRTSNRAETLHAIFGLRAWWSKPWRKHSSLKVIYSGVKTGLPLGDEFSPIAAALTSISPTRRLLAGIPHVGWEYSAAAEETFGSVEAACRADWRVWSRLRVDGATEDGRRRPRIGQKRAKSIVATLRGEAPAGRPGAR